MKLPRSLSLFAAVSLLAASWASADIAVTAMAPPDDACARENLSNFLDELRAVPQINPVLLAGAQMEVATATPEMIAGLAGNLEQIQNWQELPAILSSVSADIEQQQGVQLRRIIADHALPPGTQVDAALELERFREDMIFLLSIVRKFAPLMPPEFAERVDEVEEYFRALPREALSAARDEWYRQSANFLAPDGFSITPGSSGVSAIRPLDHFAACGCHCGDLDLVCWIGCGICAVGEAIKFVGQIGTFISDFFNNTIPNLINKVFNLAGAVFQKFTDVFNTIKNFVVDTFNSLIAAIPDTVNEVFNFISDSVKNADWASIANSIPTIAPICSGPIIDDAVTIAAEVCDRGGDAITGLLFELSPDDGLSFLVKLAVALLHKPLEYLCMCKDIEDAIAFADAQAAHRTLTTQNLDVQLSTIALNTSITDIRTTISQTNTDVTNLETNLTNILNLRLANLSQAQTEEKELLEAFEKLVTRLQIEKNLTGSSGDDDDDDDSWAVSLYQLPAAFGGHLETVSFIVNDTIKMTKDANQSVNKAEKDRDRGDSFLKVGDFIRAYNSYRQAYHEAVK